MSPFPDEFLVLCTRRLSGEASAEEQRHLDAYLQDEDCRVFYRELTTRWRDWREAPLPHFAPRRAAERLSAQIAAADAANAGAEARAKSRVLEFPLQHTRRRGAWRVALASAAAIALGVSLWLARDQLTPAVPIVWVARSAAAGETPHLVLDDGTRVTLNGESTLEFPRTFGHTRTVRLRGEAFFEVAHDAARPFVVEAGEVETTVLGTKFDVNVLPDDRGTHVALVEGRVAVTPRAAQGDARAMKQVILTPGQQFSSDKQSGFGHVEAFDRDEATGWMSGVLSFRDEPLSVVASRLQRKFGVAFDFATVDLPNKAINARFEKESLPEILEILSFAGGIRCETVRENGAIARVRLWPTQPAAGR